MIKRSNASKGAHYKDRASPKNGRIQKKPFNENTRRVSFETVARDAKLSWNNLQLKKLSADDRQAECKKLMELINAENISKFIYKHDLCRIIQTLFKHANIEQRRILIDWLKDYILLMSQSSYGRHAVEKIFLHGTNEQRALLLNNFNSKWSELSQHKEGSHTAQHIFSKYLNATQKSEAVRECFDTAYRGARGKSSSIIKDLPALEMSLEIPEQRQILVKNMVTFLNTIITKKLWHLEIAHKVLKYYVNYETSSKLNEEVVLAFLNSEEPITKDYSEALMIFISRCSAKSRKAFLKAVKSAVFDFCSEQYGADVMISVAETIDDTVLFKKVMLQGFTLDNVISGWGVPSICTLWFWIFSSERSRKVIKPSTFKVIEKVQELKKETSKKEDVVRRQELIDAFSPILLESISANTRSILEDQDQAQLMTEIILQASGDIKPAVKAVSESFSGNPLEDSNHLMRLPHCPRILKTLLQSGHWNAKSQSVVRAKNITGLDELLLPDILTYAKEWAQTNGSYVLIYLIQNGCDKLKKKLVKEKKALMKQSSDSIGLQELVKLL